MGLFNQVTADATCPRCGDRREVTVQFEHGLLDLHTYRLGDELRWDEHTRCAFVRRTSRCWREGWGPGCAACGYDLDYATFAVVFDRGRVADLVTAPLGAIFPDLAEALPLTADELPQAVLLADS